MKQMHKAAAVPLPETRRIPELESQTPVPPAVGLHPRLQQDLNEIVEIICDPRLSEFQKTVAMADWRVGVTYRQKALEVAQSRGCTWAEAKAQTHPQCPGRKFREVAMRALGRPSSPVFGSASRIVPQALPFLWRRQLAKAALGLLHVDGGGPNGMALSAALAELARKEVKELDPVSRWIGENFRVLLLVGKRETPHRFCTDENTVWGYDGLLGRTQALFSLGVTLIADFEAGGYGTLEEFVIALTMNQLMGRGEIKVPFISTVPLVMIDSDLTPDGASTFWGAQHQQFINMHAAGMIKEHDLSFVHRIHAADPNALRSYLNIISQSSLTQLKVDIVAEWERKNNWSLLDFVNELAAAHPITVEEAQLLALPESGHPVAH